MLSFDQVTSSDLLPLNNFDIPTLFHRFSSSRSYPDISFALFSLSLSCSWEVLQNLCSNHLPILLTVPLSLVFRPNERLPSLNFRKARQDDFAFYLDYHCPSAEEYSSLSFLCCCSLYFSDTECPPYDLVLWADGSVPFPFGKNGSGVLANCSICGIEATLFFSTDPVCSSISAKACAIPHALCWSRQHQQVCHFSSLLLLSDSQPVLSFFFPFYLNLC